jgi:ATP-dependent helicase HepA
VTARDAALAQMGIGKIISQNRGLCLVEYFDLPTSELVVREMASELLSEVTLDPQTRIYHYNKNNSTWEIGRLLDDHGSNQLVQFPNSSKKYLDVEEVFVRWRHPIVDPTPLLANRVNESPRFSDARSAFVRSQMRQRAASMGMSALLSCAIELEAHQIEVVRRILQDPVQRYLLADEVGLGKTIEAGVLIRQCILDMQDQCNILVLVPRSLVGQWRSELSNKFFLRGSLDNSIRVVPFDDFEMIRELLPKLSMLVIDEAHHITGQIPGGSQDIYAEIVQATPSIERVLLLSATPALHNERGFLEMLHLLDPKTYPLEGEGLFRLKIKNRQELAEIVAGLNAENALYLDYTIDQLSALFPDDTLLVEYSTELRQIIATMPDESDPVLGESIDRLRAHLSEVYRLDRRILRNRRRSIGGLTPERSGANVARYRCNDRLALTAAIDDWRHNEALRCDLAGSLNVKASSADAFQKVIGYAAQYPDPKASRFGFSGAVAAMVLAPEKITPITRSLDREGLFQNRADALIEAIRPFLDNQAQFIVFCSEPKTASSLAKRIEDQLGICVIRHDPDSEEWLAFHDRVGPSVLVCDSFAEEGLNLQGGLKIVVHYDIPFNPNRIEQRLGRSDRYGAGESVKSIVLACEDDPLEIAWVDYLNDGLKVFDRSIASLQFLLEQTVQELIPSMFDEGVEAIEDLTNESSGEHGLIEREMKAIDQQDALDALGAPSTSLIDDLSDVDDDWQTLEHETSIWLKQMLQFDHLDEPEPRSGRTLSPPFRYIYAIGNRHTLFPLSTYMKNCAQALDLNLATRRNRAIKTIPYTFSRRTALSRIARANGVGLLRYGDALMNGIATITEGDDRGRSSAMWRYAPNHAGDGIASVYFRFDFVLEADVAKANKTLRDHGRDSKAARAAIRRRGDMALPPFYRSMWLNSELVPVTEVSLLALLERPYSVDPDATGALDFNLNARRWQRLLQLRLPELDFWSDICAKARLRAEAALRAHPNLISSLASAEQQALLVDLGRIGQLRARAHTGTNPEDENDLIFEEQLAIALRNGIRAPSLRVDTVSAVFVSANRATTDQISGDH